MDITMMLLLLKSLLPLTGETNCLDKDKLSNLESPHSLELAQLEFEPRQAKNPTMLVSLSSCVLILMEN